VHHSGKTDQSLKFCIVLNSETEILTSHGWKGMGKVTVGDCAATMSNLETQKGEWSSITAVIERDMHPEEKWVVYDAPRANFRVTDNHTMIAAPSNKDKAFEKVLAKDLVSFKGGAYLPSAIYMDQPGVPLTDAELYFIGIMMTDGTWTSTSGSISQSERHHHIIQKIENCLRDIGIGYAKRRHLQYTKDKIIEKDPRWVFSFSAGKPKPIKINKGPKETKNPAVVVEGVTGFRHLLPYLDKDFATPLMGLSVRQFKILFDGIWDGDGFKKIGANYNPQTFDICSARKTFIDRLQALSAINGFTANVRYEHGNRKNPIYILSIKNVSWRHHGGYAAKNRNPRPNIHFEDATNEKVWCVETNTGTIVTRRKGKITVMGNCQMIGRGLRTAEGKDHCLILDHSDTTIRLGFVTDLYHPDLDDGEKRNMCGNRQEALAKGMS
jgi:hypothetical protein